MTSKSAITPSFSGRIALIEPGRAAEHPLRLEPDRVDVARRLVDRDHRRLAEDDAAPAHVDERVRRAEIDGHVAAAEAREVIEDAHADRRPTVAACLRQHLRSRWRPRFSTPCGTSCSRGRATSQAATAATFVLSVAIAAPLAVVFWSAEPEVWPYALASTLLETVYVVALALAYRGGELSFVYPLTRGLAPVLALGLGALVLDEAVSATGGRRCRCSSRSASSSSAGSAPPATLARFCSSSTIAATIAGYTLVDREGIQHAGALTYFVLTLAGPCLVYPPIVGIGAMRSRARAGGRGRGGRELRLVHARPAGAPPRAGRAGARGAVVVGRDRDAPGGARARRARLARRDSPGRRSSSPGIALLRAVTIGLAVIQPKP